jgi:hypothetical protein
MPPASLRECTIEAVEHAARAPALRQYGLRGPRRRRRRDVDYEEKYEDMEAFEAALAG